MKKLIQALGVCVFAITAIGQTNQSVVPAGLENQNGNSAISGFMNPGEVQQIIRSSSLQPVWPSPVFITKIAFRVQEGSILSYDAVIPSIEIRLSTSARAPEQMTPLWSQNAGADVKTVFFRENIRMVATGSAPVNPFEYGFTLDEPFYYDPNAGHLAMDFRLGGTEGYFRVSSLDGQAYPSLSTSPFGLVQPSTPIAMSHGLVTEFSWIAVPEPSSVALFCFSVLLVAGQTLRKARQYP